MAALDQVADAGAEVMQVSPEQPHQEQLDQRVTDYGAEGLEGLRRTEAAIEQIEQEGKQQEQACTTHPMKNRNDTRQREPDLIQGQVLRPLFAHCRF